MRKFLFSVLTLALLVLATGCDSSNDGQSDAELFVAIWSAVGVSDGTGDQTASFAQSVSKFEVNFADNGTYSLDVVFTDQRPRIQFGGAPYTISESTKQVTIVIPGAVTGGADLPLVFGYAFSNNNTRVALSNAAQVAFVNLLFGTTYTGTVTVTLQRS